MTGRPAAAVHAARTRLLPALLTALGVVLLTVGLLSYADPTTAGAVVEPSPDLGRAAAVDGPVAVARGAQRVGRRVRGPDRRPPSRPSAARRGTPRGSSSRRSRSTSRSSAGRTATRSATSRCTSTASASRWWTSAGPAATSRPTCSRTPATACSGPIYEQAIVKHQPDEDAGDDRPGLHGRQQALPVRDRQGAPAPAQPRRGVLRRHGGAVAADLRRPGGHAGQDPAARDSCCRWATPIPPTRTPRPSPSGATDRAEPARSSRSGAGTARSSRRPARRTR